MSDISRIIESADPSVRIQDDLFRAVNGKWLDTHEIPADLPNDGAFIQLRLQSEARVHEIVEELAAGSPEGNAKKIADLYNSYMNVDVLNALGTEPLEVDLAEVRTAASKSELALAIGRLMPTGVGTFFSFGVGTDLNDPTEYTTYLGQSGLGLPDEAYYREPGHAEVLAKYEEFVPRFATLTLGFGAEDAAAFGASVVALEKKLAATHVTIVDARNADKYNNPMPLVDFVASAPGFPWLEAIAATGAPMEKIESTIVRNPQTLRDSAAIWAQASLEDLRAYTMWRIVRARGSFLTEEIDEAVFDFYGRVLSGSAEQRDRWKRGVAVVEGILGEEIGKEYVARYFPPEHKAKMMQLIEDLLEAYRRSIRNLDWMGAETKKRALAKVDSFTPKIGYPDVWTDFSALEIGADLVQSIRNANAWERARDYAKLGTPVDRSEWLMTPQTVNAYYYNVWNEIVFPAAILQFPFFDPERDAALNYGGIGAVIGHEIGHGFDDQGSKFGPDGTLANWWTDADRAAFEERTSALVAQYDSYVPADLGEDGPHVLGALTLGENIGDLGGLSIALKAFTISLEREGITAEEAPVIEGYTAIQRVFLSWARVWQSKNRKERAETLIATDPHSPAEFRTNGVVKNIDAFAEAFDVKPGDALWLDPSERVRIW